MERLPVLGHNYVLCRVAYQATESDPTTRDRRVKDFPARTMAAAEDNALRWAADCRSQRTSADRARGPWVLERWNARDRLWEFVSRVG